MQIGELARKTGIPARMLRYYEEQGLLEPERRPNGYRDYDEALVQRAEKIRCFLDAGVPTRVIGPILHCFDQLPDTVAPTTAQNLRDLLVHERDRMALRLVTLQHEVASLSELIHTLDLQDVKGAVAS